MSETEKRDVRYFTNQRPEMVKFLPDSMSHVLEIGCGEGIFGGMLKSSTGCEVWGVEPDEVSLPAATTRLDRVLHGTFEQVYEQLPDSHFDLLICNDVIEHMPDPDWFLNTVMPKLTADAHVVVSLPNIRFWKSLWQLTALKRWQYADAGVMDRTHLRFFTKWTNQDLFESHGFAFEKLQGINRSRSYKPLPAVVLSLGYFRDIMYPQYGMLLRRVA